MSKKTHHCQPRLSRLGQLTGRPGKGILTAGAALALLALSTTPAYAYIDPGTGSMVVQAIAASVLTAGAMIGVFWKAIKNFFLSLGKRRTGGAQEKSTPAGNSQTGPKDTRQD